MHIRDRIKELRRVPARELVPNARNWRTHPDRQRRVLAGLLDELGYCDALLARELDDGRLALIDGHLRRETTPEMEVPVLVLNVSAAEADKLLLTLDPLAGLAGADSKALDELLHSVQTSDEAVAGLLTQLGRDAGAVSAAEPLPATVELPAAKFEVVVECADENQQRDVFERLQAEGLSCRVLTF